MEKPIRWTHTGLSQSWRDFYPSVLGTQAAIKVLVDTAPEEREALLAEARKIAAWRHPHITLVLGFSEHQGFPYLVLQYAPHGTLKERYPPGQAFSIDTILPHVQQIAEGLQYAHERQTLHLDLKPANVLLDEQQAALISDFGISVILQPTKTHLTVRTFMGTPAYAAPEQFDEERGRVTPASDQYALATMVYQWLTGRPPFEGALFVALATQKVFKDPPPLGANVPPLLAAVVLRGLAKDPRARYSSARVFAEALLAARYGAVGAPPAPRDQSATPVSGPLASAFQSAAPVQTSSALLSRSTPPVGTPLLTLQGSAKTAYAVAWSPDSRRLSSGDEGAARLWDAERGQLLATLFGHTNRVLAVPWSPDGRLIASASADDTVRLWDAEHEQLRATLPGHTGVVTSAAWSPDGRLLASASWDKTVRLWDAERGRPLGTLVGHTEWVYAVAWFPDSRLLASAGEDNTIYLWDTARGLLLGTLIGHTDPVNAVAWSPDGRLLASAGEDHTVRLWDTRRGVPLVTLTAHTGTVNAVAWSPDGRRLASAGDDRLVFLWDAQRGQPLTTLYGHADRVRSVAWSPDGRRLASGSNDETVRLWWMGEG